MFLLYIQVRTYNRDLIHMIRIRIILISQEWKLTAVLDLNSTRAHVVTVELKIDPSVQAVPLIELLHQLIDPPLPLALKMARREEETAGGKYRADEQPGEQWDPSLLKGHLAAAEEVDQGVFHVIPDKGTGRKVGFVS